MTRAEPGELVALLQGTPLVVMLDIDGTLCEIVERPDDAKVPPSATAALRALNGLRSLGVYLAFVTGRSVADARRMIDLDEVIIYGNHGMERLYPSGNIREPDGWNSWGSSLREAARDIAELIRRFPGAALEDKQFSLTLHYRAMKPQLFASLEARVGDIARRHGLKARDGKQMMSIVPAGAFDKGDAVLEILHECVPETSRSDASILFAGDDVTDEDAFAALKQLPGAVTVRVGDASAATAAKWSLATPMEVYQLLDLILESRR